ncbi:glycoside hydrolase family 3 N-terminal domain-containing protein [Bifidobacterium asteroides]|uniref:glycoside hydrolase family 3 N-terminal domain-containing protein n=1 Tax=Bifidobacterium asteroides TaxID=1684 RepID=UPI0027424255|nr:glycoside hydrolase family 3 N-terminal domain-containing protein [Bifidobacterium asteroides]WLT11075.1 glycoside hydrolase family 3 N-terminal domain-containing protein [Bifidobacterium asteroides]
MASRKLTGDLPYRNPDLSVDERVADLLGRMTREEKVGQMMQLDARQGVDKEVVDQHAGSLLHVSPQNMIKADKAVHRTRLGIPLLIGDDCIHGHSFFRGATIFPEQLGMAASFDPELVQRMGRATAQEVATTGVHWTFSPVLCIARDTRWGRVDETFGEDPFLIGEMASAMVRGYQGGSAMTGTLPKDAVLATAKHFAGYSETQGGRDASEADLSHRKLLSWFLPPFERLAKEGVATFMLGYESIDGVPVTINNWLLNDVLRGEWGYQGTLITDWDNVGRMVWEQKVQPDYTRAAAAAVKAGNDLIMTTPGFYQGALDALDAGLLREEDLDRAVRHILALKFRMGLFEDPRLPDPEAQKAVINSPEHQELNLQVAQESAVLLKNDGILPLFGGVDADGRPGDDSAHSIALVGPLIDDAQNQLGDWAGGSGQCDWIKDQPREMISTVADGLRQELPENWRLGCEQGVDMLRLVDDPAGPLFPDGQPRPRVAAPARIDQGRFDRAVGLARQSDLVVAVVGDVVQLVGEGRSTATLELYGPQRDLLDALAQTGKPMVIVLMSSKPLVLPPSAQSAKALIWQPDPGMQGGRALARILTGMVEPTGRLPITFPRHAGQLPVYYNQIRGQHGDRYADLTQEPAFAFGQGMGYTTFAYGKPQVDGSDAVGPEDRVRVTVDLTNTGQRPGTEVVQAYISDLVTSVSWADRELKAFQRIQLDPGQTRKVVFDLPVAEWALVDADCNRRVEPGQFQVLVGSSSRREDLQAVTVTVG